MIEAEQVGGELPYWLAVEYYAWVIVSDKKPLERIEVIIPPEWWEKAQKQLIKGYGKTCLREGGGGTIYIYENNIHIHVSPMLLDDFVMRTIVPVTYYHVRRAVSLKSTNE